MASRNGQELQIQSGLFSVFICGQQVVLNFRRSLFFSHLSSWNLASSSQFPKWPFIVKPNGTHYIRLILGINYAIYWRIILVYSVVFSYTVYVCILEQFLFCVKNSNIIPSTKRCYTRISFSRVINFVVQGLLESSSLMH